MPSGMIESIEIRNFKSYSKGLLFLSPMTVLIGANASGKSNAIEALRFISWLAQGQKLSSIQYSVNAEDKVFRGSSQSIIRSGADNFGLSCSVFGDTHLKWEICIEFRKDGLHIIEEKLRRESDIVPVYSLDQPSADRGTDVKVSFNNFARGRNKPQVICTDQIPIFLQLSSPVIFSNSPRSQLIIPESVNLIENLLANIIFLDPNPQKMRDYSFPTDEKLQGDGANLSAVLFNICGQPNNGASLVRHALGDGDHEGWFQIMDFIQSLPEQKIEGLSFIREPRGGVMVQLVESFGGNEQFFDASLLSDGTLRILSIAAALLSAPAGAMVVIEELDNGVHPNRAQHLLRSIRRIAEERKLRVLMSTHNPALLDALPDESLGDVVFCYRSPDDGTSKLLRLSDSESYIDLVSQGPLGGLLTDGIIDRFAKRHVSNEQKVKAYSKWLKSVR